MPLGQLGMSPLHVAASQGQERQVELLCLHGGDPWIKDAAGKTPLAHALWVPENWREGGESPYEVIFAFAVFRKSWKFQCKHASNKRSTIFCWLLWLKAQISSGVTSVKNSFQIRVQCSYILRKIYNLQREQLFEARKENSRTDVWSSWCHGVLPDGLLPWSWTGKSCKLVVQFRVLNGISWVSLCRLKSDNHSSSVGLQTESLQRPV